MLVEVLSLIDRCNYLNDFKEYTEPDKCTQYLKIKILTVEVRISQLRQTSFDMYSYFILKKNYINYCDLE